MVFLVDFTFIDLKRSPHRGARRSAQDAPAKHDNGAHDFVLHSSNVSNSSISSPNWLTSVSTANPLELSQWLPDLMPIAYLRM
ncbi:hypothetical protein [Paraburkholderia ferrariae]|uniref:hypothetical protein n=1 Tax=Paraburkholderia ferrariae TaxID=386056 RepID=UPI00319E1316